MRRDSLRLMRRFGGCWVLCGRGLVSIHLSIHSSIYLCIHISVGIVANSLDLLIIGMGESMFPLSPETKKHINALGIRIEILDTRNAAAQFNMLATERGVSEIAAAMIPLGWKGR